MATLGQDNSTVTAAEALLTTDGSNVLYAYVVAAVPIMGLPIINFITRQVVTAVVGFIINEIDYAAFAVYVAATVGKQTSDYIAAVSSGSQAATDSNADNLIHLGVH